MPSHSLPAGSDREPPAERAGRRSGVGRRQFLGYVLAAPTLVVAAKLGKDALTPHAAGAAVPSPPEPADLMDLGDLLTLAATPTSNLIAIQVNTDGTASFALPRAEVGQGITTSVAMLIAEETRPAARQGRRARSPTPGRSCCSTSSPAGRTRSARCTRPVRTAAAIARQRLLQTAAAQVERAGRDAHDAATASSGPTSGKTATYGVAGQGGRRVEDRRRCRSQLKPARRLRRRRHAAEPHRRARRGHRPQEVRHGPRRAGRAADDGLPAADDQRHGPSRSTNLAAVTRHAGHHRRRGRSRPAWPCAARRSASASTRSARWT